jgi:hypothetical protein
MMAIGKNNFSMPWSIDRSLVGEANGAGDKIVIRIGAEYVHGIPLKGNQVIQFNYTSILSFHAIFFDVSNDTILDASVATKKEKQNRKNTRLYHCKAVFKVLAGKRSCIPFPARTRIKK